MVFTSRIKLSACLCIPIMQSYAMPTHCAIIIVNDFGLWPTRTLSFLLQVAVEHHTCFLPATVLPDDGQWRRSGGCAGRSGWPGHYGLGRRGRPRAASGDLWPQAAAAAAHQGWDGSWEISGRLGWEDRIVAGDLMDCGRGCSQLRRLELVLWIFIVSANYTMNDVFCVF